VASRVGDRGRGDRDRVQETGKTLSCLLTPVSLIPALLAQFLELDVLEFDVHLRVTRMDLESDDSFRGSWILTFIVREILVDGHFAVQLDGDMVAFCEDIVVVVFGGL
jgi:hypothetical protein